jgi:hypothetical protein
MNDEIKQQFSKHYKRIIEDLKQVNGFTPAMEKLISVNLNKLENDIYEVTRYENYNKN